MNHLGAKHFLVVGAGFSGAVIARELADHGYRVDVIDSRDHIAGNCYDPRDSISGVRVHKYGPHIFHTNDKKIFEYVSRYTKWIDYEHKVQAYVDGLGFVPFPLNIVSINRLYDKKLTNEEQVKGFLRTLAVKHANPNNAMELAESLYGKDIVELFFSRYTRKMWGLGLDELPVSIIKRLPVRYDYREGYFDDTFQGLPVDGYVGLFDNLLDHPAITVNLSTSFDKSMEKKYTHVFNSMPIDVYYEYRYGALPYRSIKFTQHNGRFHNQSVPTVNLTDLSDHTRVTDWSLYPSSGKVTNMESFTTMETPCSYEDNHNERYYPVKTIDRVPQQRYEKYRNLAEKEEKVTFIGRCGQYQYLDMHQAIANSLKIVNTYLNALG